MQDQTRFLQAIRESPDDDVPRLQYADWLDEHGDPRGEFIRIQIALAKTENDDPRWPLLKQRERELWRAHQGSWLPEEARLRGCGAVEVSWSRGFPDTIRLYATDFLLHARAIRNAAPIASLRLDFVDTLTAGRLAECPELSAIPRLTILGMPGPRTDVRALFQSPHLSRLRHLGLILCGLKANGVAELAASPHLQNLQSLDLSSNGIGNEGVQHLLHSTLALKSLKLGDTALDGVGVTALCTSRLAQGLEDLDLSANEIGDDGVARLVDPKSSQLQRLRRLVLADTDLDLAGVRALAASPLLANVRHLTLADNQVGPFGLAELVESPHLGQLRELELYRSGITADGAAVLANAQHLTGLTFLGLGRNSLGDDGVSALADSPHLSGLQWLDLRENGVRELGARALARSRYLSSLRTLDLRRNALGEAGVRELTHSPFPPHLDRLCLNGNDIGDGGVGLLANAASLAGLRHLELEANGIRRAGALALANSRLFADLEHLQLRTNHLEAEGVRALAATPQRSQLQFLDIRENHIHNSSGVLALLHSPMLASLMRLNVEDLGPEGYQRQQRINEILAADRERGLQRGRH